MTISSAEAKKISVSVLRASAAHDWTEAPFDFEACSRGHLACVGLGWTIPETACAGDIDTRSPGEFAKWLRANAVEKAALTIARDAEFQEEILTNIGIARTPAQRKADERQRRADAGLVRLPDLWAHPEDHADIKAHAAKLAARRQRKDKREAG